jgi:hypothetical protein
MAKPVTPQAFECTRDHTGVGVYNEDHPPGDMIDGGRDSIDMIREPE